MFERRAKKGQCFHRPYLGCREFAFTSDWPTRVKSKNSLSMRLMIWASCYTILDFEKDPDNPPAQFFRAFMKQGVINTDRGGKWR